MAFLFEKRVNLTLLVNLADEAARSLFSRALVSLALISSALFWAGSNAFAADGDSDSLASLHSKEGEVEGQGQGTAWESIEVGATFSTADAVKVGRRGRAGIQFIDGGFVRLSNGAVLRFESMRREVSSLSLDSGKAHFLNRLGGLEPEILTPYVSAAARGTEFVVNVEDGQTRIAVLSGSVSATNQFGSTTASRGEEVVAPQGKAPFRRVLVDPVESVQWTLRLPSQGLISDMLPRTASGSCPSDAADSGIDALRACAPSAERDLAIALSNLDRGDFTSAREQLESVSQRVGASLETRSAALSMLALVAIISNQVDAAEAHLASAEALVPATPLMRLVRSYFFQARGDVAQALSAIGPQDDLDAASLELFVLRAAELSLMNNDNRRASALLASLPEQGSMGAEVQNLKGFIALNERRIADAETHFLASMHYDSAGAAARFGLGLVASARGDFEQARDQFMAAVSLDPTQSSYRHYLSKAYFELGAESRALEELDASIMIDAQDPTPFLYRSFIELSQNRPITALRSIEESIRLNNNRAVFRSSNLLDQDRAVRSASIGRIFEDLGLQGAARNEALRSISLDYLNHSAHQLLADATDALNEADASISARRIASLLAPLSLNTLANVGGRTSFNEYSALFDTAQTRTAWSLSWDGRDDIGAIEGSLATLEGDWGFSLLFQSALGDGSKSNDYLRDYRLFTNLEYQAAPSSRLRLTLDGRFQDIEDSYQSPQDSEFTSGAAELSLTETIDAQTTLLSTVRLVREEADSDGLLERPGALLNLFPDEPFDLDTLFLVDERNEEDLLRMQASSQIIKNLGNTNIVAGAQLSAIDTERNEDSTILDDETGLFSLTPWQLQSEGENDLRGADAYAYLSHRPLDWLTLTGGANATTLEYEARPISPFLEKTFRENHVSPKLGLLAEPAQGLLFRSAYFETLSKATLEDQSSIEPIVVGGFSQKFNDQAGTLARAFATGLDYKIPGESYLGVEWIGRWLREESTFAMPVFDFDFSVPSFVDGIGLDDVTQFSKQDLVRAYYAQLFGSSWVLGFDYQWTELRRTDPDAFESQQTHRLGSVLRYFHPSGLFGLAKATWRSQDRLGGIDFSDGTEEFMIYDVALGYRLPRRQGRFTIELLNLGGENFEYDQAFGFEPFIASKFAILARAEVNF